MDRFKGYLPYTQSAISPSCTNLILNDIIINRRTSIVEFGSGISTLLICALLDERGIEASFISIDESLDWIETLKDTLRKKRIREKSVNLYMHKLMSIPIDLNLITKIKLR